MSAIKICNIALARLGEAPIRDFDENNKRARLCSVLYPHSKDYILGRYAWSFAKSVRALQTTTDESNFYAYIYQKPSDCLMPIDILPIGRDKEWRLWGSKIYTDISEAELLYVNSEVTEGQFNIPFEAAVSAHLALLLAHPIVQDADIVKLAREESERVFLQSAEEDASIGSDHLHPDRDPDNSRFVDVDGVRSETDASRFLSQEV